MKLLASILIKTVLILSTFKKTIKVFLSPYLLTLSYKFKTRMVSGTDDYDPMQEVQ